MAPHRPYPARKRLITHSALGEICHFELSFAGEPLVCKARSRGAAWPISAPLS